MYLILVVSSMVFINLDRYAIGWSLFFLGLLMWAFLLGLEINNNDNT